MKHLLCISLAIIFLAGCAAPGVVDTATGKPQASAVADNRTAQPGQAASDAEVGQNTGDIPVVAKASRVPQHILFLRIDTKRSSPNMYGKYDLTAANRDIFVMDPDGSNAVNLTKGSINAASADWSPDKSMVVFDSVNSSLQGYPVCTISTMDTDGSNIKQVSPGSESRHFPAWSHDGKKIANVKYVVQSCAGRPVPCKYYSLLTFNQDGSGDARLTFSSPTGHQMLPRWFPDGKRIAFLDSESASYGFWSGDASGEGDLKKYDIESNATYMPWFSLSPDGAKIVYSHDSPQNRLDYYHTGRELYMYDIATGEINQLTKNDYADDNPCFSPDGRQIVFAAFGDTEGTSGMFVMDVDGKNPRQISSKYGDIPMKWR